MTLSNIIDNTSYNFCWSFSLFLFLFISSKLTLRLYICETCHLLQNRVFRIEGCFRLIRGRRSMYFGCKRAKITTGFPSATFRSYGLRCRNKQNKKNFVQSSNSIKIGKYFHFPLEKSFMQCQ